jgi:lipopolysaccharide/colanic/teichoic acid biosynthesis glycosyltransferase
MIKALYIGTKCEGMSNLDRAVDRLITLTKTVELVMNRKELGSVNLVIADKDQKGTNSDNILHLLRLNGVNNDVPIILVGQSFTHEERKRFMQLGYAELCVRSENLLPLVRMVLSKNTNQIVQQKASVKRTSIAKRAFDIAFAGTFLLFASPILAAIAIGIRLDSKGPIVYRSKRVGQGYEVFDFLKFRTMKMNADHLVKDMMKENQYKNEETIGAFAKARSNEYLIDAMGNTIDEETFIANRKIEKAGAFFKVQNDPRITRIGRFLRATSLDELPQFLNVLKGDMSIIGNRPLPLYEAEKLTTDQWAARFLAPAGITGLWQVEKRGKADISETERKELDNAYTKNQSFWYDMRILFKTIPALLQKENV